MQGRCLKMSNQVENNVVLDGAELTKIKTEMMHYRGNGLSYKLGFLGIGFSILGAFICLNSFYPDMLGFLKILMNIAILLFGFLCCEKVKAYSKQAAITMCAIGGVCVLRIFWIPLNIMVWFNKFTDASTKLKDANAIISSTTATQDQKDAAQIIVSESNKIISEAGKYIGKIITTSDSTVNWLPQDGNFRSVLAMVLLACAAAAFIAAGVIGIIKSNRYMASRNGKIGG